MSEVCLNNMRSVTQADTDSSICLKAPLDLVIGTRAKLCSKYAWSAKVRKSEILRVVPKLPPVIVQRVFKSKLKQW